MLFVNFLCLLYLMLLVNGLTVSKNIDNKYFDERVDSIHDFEYTTSHKSKHDKFLHKHRRIKSGITTPASKVTIRVTTNEAKSTKTSLRTQQIKVHKSTKRRLGGFWRKFKIKEDKALKPQLPNAKYTFERPPYIDEYKNKDKRLANKRRKNIYTCSFKHKKREATYQVPKKLNKPKEEKGFKNVQINITPYENISNTAKVTTYLRTVSKDEELKKMLTTMTTKVTELKRLYGLEKYNPSYTSHKILHTTKHSTTKTSTESFDIPGTAQLEALLDDIKEKALHLIVEQNPAITDLITNTVTEATFEADPLLTHLEVNSPAAYSLYTFITLNSDYGKRNADITKPDDEKSTVNIKTHMNCNREGRSVAEDAMTAAQSIEDILQKEIKNIYNKVKNKVSGDFRKEVDKVKTTIKPQSKKICSKDAPAKQRTATKTGTATSKNTKSTMQLLQNRVNRKSGKNTKVTEQEITSTADDYALLTLYEQMLSKSNQNNIMNILTSQEKIIRKKRDKQLVSNHNFKTLLNQNLKEDIKKLYEDREEVPDELEYNFEINLPEIPTVESETESDYSHATGNATETRNEIDENIGTEITPYDDNSYESLTSKISYNEYVNGYKHYLNFQKEQANEKFSDLVKYQAHRHHSIDDIGKYILNKIPQQPPRDKRFFEYEDDHDLSTKSEESWFKKHFYMFIDNGIPKKYHTSQTISLKSPTPDAYDTPVHSTETSERYEFQDKLKMASEAQDNNVDINLEKLSQALEEHKASSAVLPVHENALKNSDSKNTGKRHGHIIFKSFTPHLIDKVFGKDRKNREGADVKSYNPNLNDINIPAEYSNYEKIRDINFLFSNELDRKKRNTKYHKVDSTTFGQKLMLQTKKNATLINVKKTKKKTDNAKLGCVDINVVVPTISIVKLKGTKRKEGKLKNLLQKLHLSKSNKPKIKREYGSTEYTRKQRSNPFQKLKNIFKPTPKSKVLKSDSHLSDYDIMSSHIDTFKPVKYDKVLNIEEMKKQIPNITSDLVAGIAPKFANNHISWNPRTTRKGFADLAVLLNTTLMSLSMTPVPNLPQLVNDLYRYSTTKKSKTQDIEELLKVNVKTESSYEPYKKISFPQHLALNDIKDQVENMIIKINSDNNNKIYSSEAITNSFFLMNNKIPINRVLLQSKLNSFYTKNPKNSTYSKARLKIVPNSEKHTILDLEQNSEFVEDNSYLKTPEPKFNDNELITQPVITTAIPTGSLLFLSSSSDEEKEKYKPYPDYFSDLLMWNKDILNSDRVPTPWRDILKNVNHELEYSARDTGDLQNEPINMNDGLKPNLMSFKESSTPTYSHERIIPRNWLQSMVLEKPPSAKSVFIKQEKKCVKFDPSLTDRHLKAADIVNELNKFAKTFSDETKYNLNNIHNPPENTFENKDLSRILVDTTLLAYDDDINYISTLTPRELSKNAQNIASIGNNVAASLKPKSNKQPLQYFATPLPMEMTDFQEFLKDNKLDVESVTSPIVNLPTLNAYTSNKYTKNIPAKKITTSNTMKKQKTTKAKTTKPKSHDVSITRKILFPVMNDKDFDSQFHYLDDLKWNILKDYYNSEEKERFKRYKDLHYDSYFMNLNADTKQSNKANKEMKKHKLSNKKPFTNIESDLKIKAILETAENVTPKDFDITIINYGDINKLTDEYPPINSETTTENITEVSEKTFGNVEQTPLNVDLIEKGSKDSEFLHKLHNNLFYDEAYAKSKETVTEPTETIKIQDTTVPITSLAFHEAVLKKMPINTNYKPKRVRISSQSYKYDIIYHHPEKIKKHHGRRDHTHLPSYVTTTADTTSEELFSIYNSDFACARKSDVAGGDCGKSRVVRKIKTSNQNTLDNIGYTEEPSTTSSLKAYSKKNPRHKLKKFFPVIHDKLNIFSKHSSLSNFLYKPSTILLSRSSESSKKKLSKTIKSQKSAAEMACIKKELIEFLNKYSDDSTRKQLEKVVNKTTNEKFKTLKPVVSLTTKVNMNETKNAYVELGINEKQAYVDMDSEERRTTKQTKTFNITNAYTNKDYINKREIQDLETHTAKDVAALEVIIDMMKNPVNYHEDNQHSTSNGNNKLQANDQINANTNSIQVHIAVPYESENSKKRSLAQVKMRKVFTAKLSTPVDIEYQVHSFEESPITKKPLEDMEGLSPGLYLIVDSTYFPRNVSLSPMEIRQVKHMTEIFTSTVPSKKLAKVTLSKDFISAINKQLLLLYNITTIDKDKRDFTNDTKRDKNKRSINWNVVNNFFGHDRVCHCKCKVNKTLCKACAASDSVMSELIFELENLSKYMTDHCTEIQTYFWMNPSGGKRLKDSVHKIDQSLRDYYKRIRGKCQGRTCKTFAPLIDKRELHNNHKISKNAGLNFINDLETVAKDIEKATKTVTCFKENLQQEVNKFKHIINDYKLIKTNEKRSDFHYRQDKDIKNVYSLDKVHVNIICNSESTLPYIESINPHNYEKNVWIDTEYKEQKPKGFMGLFSSFRKKKKDKSFAEYFKQTNKSFHKREVKENQIESPLISDTGGSFWHDYIRKSSNQPKFARGSKLKNEIQPNNDDKAVTNKNDKPKEFTEGKLEDNILSSIESYTTNISNNNSSEGGEFVRNINQFIKLVNNVDVRQLTDNSPPHKISTTIKNKTKKIKHKKPKSKIHHTIKTKIPKKPNINNVTKIPNNITESQYKYNMKATTTNLRGTKTLSIFNMKSLFKTAKETTTEQPTVTKTNFFKKFKMITTDFFKNMRNASIPLENAPVKREHNFSATSSECIAKYDNTGIKNSQRDEHVISDTTTVINTNIIIIDDTDEPKSNRYKDLLLSIIDYESNKLNKEWIKFANFNLDARETKQKNDHKTTKNLKTYKNKDITMKYDILHDLKPLLSTKSNETKTSISVSALLDKIGKKFRIKIVNNKGAAQIKTDVSKKSSTNTNKMQSSATPDSREADDSTAEPCICNIEATRQHILDIRNEMPIKDFEEYITNITCQKYEQAPKAIFLEKPRIQDNRNMKKWSWIRNRRSTFRSKSNPKDNTGKILRLVSPEFEAFYREKYGIYKQIIRKKRSADFMNDLYNLPQLHDSENKIYTLAGDTVNMSCSDDSRQPKDLSSDNWVWKTERDSMLHYTNVVVDGDVVNIAGVQPKNDGYYICKQYGLMKRKIKLAVLTLPNLMLLSTLLYTKDTECTHDDLTKLKFLGPEISKKVFQEQCSVKIYDSVCLNGKVDGKTQVRGVGKVDCSGPAVDCGVSCRRDLQTAFASMAAENIPALASIEVVLLQNGVNSTWTPSKYHRKSVVTRNLRDFTSHKDQKYDTDLAPGILHLVVSCPAGYRLLSHLMLCATCPVNTYARKGDNTCLVCPRGSHSTPGADRCRRAITTSRRYDWWICPPCGYSVAVMVTLCCCGVCVALALLVQMTTRCCCGATNDYNAKDSSELPEKMKFRNDPGLTRSSRVILARFFKPSMTSSMATDSQETKFDMWKARNLAPPLPPIDFDS